MAGGLCAGSRPAAESIEAAYAALTNQFALVRVLWVSNGLAGLWQLVFNCDF